MSFINYLLGESIKKKSNKKVLTIDLSSIGLEINKTVTYNFQIVTTNGHQIRSEGEATEHTYLFNIEKSHSNVYGTSIYEIMEFDVENINVITDPLSNSQEYRIYKMKLDEKEIYNSAFVAISNNIIEGASILKNDAIKGLKVKDLIGKTIFMLQ